MTDDYLSLPSAARWLARQWQRGGDGRSFRDLNLQAEAEIVHKAAMTGQLPCFKQDETGKLRELGPAQFDLFRDGSGFAALDAGDFRVREHDLAEAFGVKKAPVQFSPAAAGKTRPKLERVQRAINELYPDGVPDQANEPNNSLCRRVSEKLAKAGFDKVSDDTILRAAGRRK
jgi:hypothetical protein